MRIQYLKLRIMTRTLCLSVFVAFKGTNFSILFAIIAASVLSCGALKSLSVHHS